MNINVNSRFQLYFAICTKDKDYRFIVIQSEVVLCDTFLSTPYILSMDSIHSHIVQEKINPSHK